VISRLVSSGKGVLKDRRFYLYACGAQVGNPVDHNCHSERSEESRSYKKKTGFFVASLLRMTQRCLFWGASLPNSPKIVVY